MLSPDIFHPYQDDSVTQLYERPRVLAIMPTGAGKTITGLTAFKELQDDGEARAGIIMAPKRVAMSVWPSELHKWTHTQHMTVKAVSGTPAQRKAALAEIADLHTVGMDNIVWLLAQAQTWKKDDPRLDLLVVDEVSRCKNARGAWAKALRKLAPLFKSVWLLTGTPRPNSDLEYYVYMDVVGQSRVWARSFDVWRREFFYPTDYEQRVWEPHRHMLPKLREDVARWSFKVPEDVVPRPNCDPIVHTIKLPRKVQVKYDEMEKALFTEIGDTDIVAFSKAVSSGKLAQIAQGFLYDDEKNAHFLHNEKMGMLEHVMNLNGPDASLILYHFNEDMRRLKDAFPGLEYIGEGVSDKRALELEDEWNAGNLERLAIHPASAGHGLNLQNTPAQLCHYCLTWSAELYKQVRDRVARQGYVGTTPTDNYPETRTEWMVLNHFIVAEGTVDELKVSRVRGKMTAEAAALQYIKSVRTK